MRNIPNKKATIHFKTLGFYEAFWEVLDSHFDYHHEDDFDDDDNVPSWFIGEGYYDDDKNLIGLVEF